MKRRRWLRLSAGALLATGLWPGCARWANNGRGSAFRFLAINGTHFHTTQCPAWFERVRASVLTQQPKPEFCLMIGDLAQNGTQAELGPMRDVLRSFQMDLYVVPGNHDWISDTDRSAWDQLFADSLNYGFDHRGWQFIGLDSTQGLAWQKTQIQPATFSWLDQHLRKLQPAAPTVLFTHFPLGPDVTYRPTNADELLARFRDFNLVAVLDGHFHGFTERLVGSTVVTTNRCCAISRDNHDGTKEKGYFVCTAANGQVTRQFVEIKA